MLLKINLFLICLSCAAYSDIDSAMYEQLIEKGSAAIERGDFESAYNMSLPYAEAGNSEAQFTVALIMVSGYGGGNTELSEKDRNFLAFKWLEKAGLNGHLEAANTLANTYKHGWYGQQQNSALSECWSKVSSGERLPVECNKDVGRKSKRKLN